MDLPVARDATILSQRNEGGFRAAKVVCYHDCGAMRKRAELVEIVEQKDCRVTYVDPRYGAFYFIIPPGINNPLKGLTDSETEVQIVPFNQHVTDIPPRPSAQ